MGKVHQSHLPQCGLIRDTESITRDVPYGLYEVLAHHGPCVVLRGTQVVPTNHPSGCLKAGLLEPYKQPRKLVLGNKPVRGPHRSYTRAEMAGRRYLHTQNRVHGKTAGRPAETTWGPGSALLPLLGTAGPQTAQRRHPPEAHRCRHAGRC